MFRYWNGRSWSEEVTSNPSSPAPTTISGAASNPGAPYDQPRRRKVGLWVAAGIGALALGLIVWGLAALIPNLTGGTNPWAPGGNGSVDMCNIGMTGSASTSPVPTRPGEVSTQHLSYPLMPKPWQEPSEENRVPFGTIVVTQEALDQATYDGPGTGWVSSAIVADLMSGDGFASAQNAAELSYKCILGKFYGDNQVSGKILTSEKRTVAGHSAWYIESQLSFDVPGLNAKGERVLIMVVEVGNDEYSMFYGSVPDTSAARLPEVRDAMSKLKVYE
jgi:hypothetical protein